jgi:nucleoside-diphosphate-sugar epimerase
MKVLVTGAGGYLGQGLVLPFEGHVDLRLMDVVDFTTSHEKIVSSVADLDAVQRAVEGVYGIVIAHMA